MPHYQDFITIQTQGKCFHKVTPQVQTVVAAADIQTGLCTLFLRHTSASLIIQENADLDTYFAKLAPEGPYYRHHTEGPDDMPAHLRTVLTQTTETIPIGRGRLLLGTWQGIYIWEHRQHGSRRELVVHVSGA
jgi:secondary thiamine-phosphate synthase enzyme